MSVIVISAPELPCHAVAALDCGRGATLLSQSRRPALVIAWTYASINATWTIVASGVTTRIDEEVGGTMPTGAATRL
jgi:hypothetical protein